MQFVNLVYLFIEDRKTMMQTSTHLDEDFPAMFPTKNHLQHFCQISPHLFEEIEVTELA